MSVDEIKKKIRNVGQERSELEARIATLQQEEKYVILFTTFCYWCIYCFIHVFYAVFVDLRWVSTEQVPA